MGTEMEAGSPTKVAGRAADGGSGRGRLAPVSRRSFVRGNWNREVVQRSEGLWVHSAGGWRGRLRSLLGDYGRGLQDARGRRAAGVRHRPRTEGSAGGQRP